MFDSFERKTGASDRMTEVRIVRSVRICGRCEAKRGPVDYSIDKSAVCRGKSVRCGEAISEIERCRRI
jgi:hypothetical protein